MAKRVGVILSGCGHRDGSEIGEAVVTLLALDRAGAQVICAAPDESQTVLVNHRSGEVASAKAKRNTLVEAARIARGRIRALAELADSEIDALIFPGGEGVAHNLSTYAEKAELCEVHPDVGRLLRAMLASHKPIGLICLAPILAARILGPVAGVRLTLGPRGTPAAKHAAVMGADVRPCPVDDVVIDQKARVISTPAYMYEEAGLRQVALGIEKLVRSVLAMARDRAPHAPGPLAPAVPGDLGSRDVAGQPTGRGRGFA
jgi:enhancing lycopene biosynthesis protein 2